LLALIIGGVVSFDMANTYTQIYIQVVFAVEGRQSLISAEHKDELQKYMTGIVTHKGQKLIAINNDRGWVRGRFRWQEGFGAFSYSHSHLTRVIRYIANQENHHRRQTFREEYLQVLDRFEVPHDQRYIFKEIEPVNSVNDELCHP
jgi:putative transposase